MALPPLVDPGPPLTPEEVDRYSRHVVLPALGEDAQRRLRRAKVCVLGAGGLGSPALLYLAAAGIGTLGILDDDDVELSNLARQVLHGTADVGRPKVDSAARRIGALDPGVHLRTHRCRLSAANAVELLSDYDVVVDGSDNFATRYAVDDACTHLGLPLVWASVLGFDAQVSVFWGRPPAGSDVEPVRLRDLFPEPPATGVVPSCAEAGVLGAVCGSVGALQAAEVVKLVTGIGTPLLGRVLVLDALAARFREVPLRRAGLPAAPPTSMPPISMTPSSRPEPAEGQIDAQELATALHRRDEGGEDFLLLDVRESAERAEACIPGSQPVPLAQVLSESGRAALPRHLPVVVSCQSGTRSALAAHALREAGFGQVRNLTGGLEAWLAWASPANADAGTRPPQ